MSQSRQAHDAGAALLPLLPRKPLLIVGGYGYRNAGDEAILAGLLRLTGKDGVTVVSRAPVETARVHGVRSITIRSAATALASHRGVVIGGGGLFGRDMGRLGRLLPLAGLAAAAAGREVVLAGIGVDRDMPRSTGRFLGPLGRRARSVIVRDTQSQALLAELGIGAVVAPDLSSLVHSAGPGAGRRSLEAAGFEPAKRPVVGLMLTAVDPVLAGRIEHAVTAAVDALPDVDFALVPLSRHPFVAAHNDEGFARRLVALRPRLRIVTPPDDTAALLGLFDALRVAVCMRYHSLVFAERAGIPIVPIAYAEKCRHWLEARALRSVEPSAERLLAALGAALERSAGSAAAPRRTRAAA